MNMKTHNISKAVVGIIGIIALSVPSLTLGATQITFQPAGSLSVEEGESITLEVYGTPDAETIYTLVGGLSFSSDVVSVSDFTFADGWQALSQPGYDEVDNNNGTLIKTGGYAGGFSTQTLLGTVTLTADAVGLASISVNSDSAAYDQDSVDVIASSHPQGTLTLDVVEAEAPATQTQTTQTTPDTSVSNEDGGVAPEGPAEEADETALEAQAAAVGQSATSSNLGAVGGILTLGTGSSIGTVILVLIILGLLYAGYYFFYLRRKEDDFGSSSDNNNS